LRAASSSNSIVASRLSGEEGAGSGVDSAAALRGSSRGSGEPSEGAGDFELAFMVGVLIAKPCNNGKCRNEMKTAE